MLRIPFNKLYRAFPELDRFSDQQCEKLMKRLDVKGYGAVAVRGWTAVAVVVGFAGSCGLVGCVGAMVDDSRGGGSLTAPLLMLCAFFVPPAVVGFLTRDLLLRHFLIKAIHVQLDRVRCPQCKYILLGQAAVNGAVTCPECGAPVTLRRLGITEADLIPPVAGEAREMDFGPTA
jgi:hypothetical protein